MFQFERSVAKQKILRRVLENDPDFQEDLKERNILQSKSRETEFAELLPILLNGSRDQIKKAKDRFLLSKFNFDFWIGYLRYDMIRII